MSFRDSRMLVEVALVIVRVVVGLVGVVVRCKLVWWVEFVVVESE